MWQTAISRLKSGHIKVFPFIGAGRLLLFAPSARLSKPLRSHLGLLGTFEEDLFPLPRGIGLLKGQWSFGSCLTPSDRLRI
ncbi:hypothetical protein TNCV_733031 [Trichonephila clavipes]|nr:hypothetical protein TNCV_733031 [Trichonephila clavipes]